MAFNLFSRSAPRADRERVADFQERLRAINIQVAGRFARGNVAIQRGQILTAEGLEAERDALRQSLAQGSQYP